MNFLFQFAFPLWIGLLAAVLALLAQFPGASALMNHAWSAPSFMPLWVHSLASPWAVFVVVALTIALGFFVRQARIFDGLADLFAHVHQPAQPDSAMRWRTRAFISLALAITGRAGVEGPGIEAAQAAGIAGRSRSEQWFEQRRRTDASVAVAAGVAAALGAPFAAMVLALELGLGGRALSCVLAALSAAFVARGAGFELGIPSAGTWPALMPAFEWTHISHWCALAIGTLAAAVLVAVLVPAISSARAAFIALERSGGIATRYAGAGILLVLIAALHSPVGGNFGAPLVTLDALFWDTGARARAFSEFVAQTLALLVLAGGFGTAGILTPVLAVGASLGVAIGIAVFSSPALAVFCGLAAAAGAWSCAFSAPVSAALLIFEFSGKPFFAVSVFFMLLLSRWIFQVLHGRSLVDRQLLDRSVRVQGGRSLEVLESIVVQDAMVTDYDQVEDQSSIEELWEVLKRSTYPFLPVVDRQKKYLGLLTFEMIQEAWQFRHNPEQPAHAPLTRLLEAKDLLYRSGFAPPTARLDEPLSRVTAVLANHPCLPVLDKDRRVLGLLFSHGVRMAYDRAVARRSLELETRAVLE